MKYFSALSLAAGGILAYAAFLFFRYNAPIVRSLPLLAGWIGLLILAMIALSLLDLFGRARPEGKNRWAGLLPLLTAGMLVYTFLQGTVTDYFQPFSLYDDVIYLTLTAFLLLILRFVILAVAGLIDCGLGRNAALLSVVALLFVFTFPVWNLLQRDYPYENIAGEPLALFPSGEGGYEIFRIPSLLVIPRGSVLADGMQLEDDLVLAFAEARRNGSLDDGEVDLVLKRSLDGGRTWSGLAVVRRWEGGVGKIGNATPVFDGATGNLFLFHIAAARPPYTTWIMESADGGITFGEARELGPGVVGPGHGIQTGAGWLVVPAHVDGSSLAWLSDDHGRNWRLSAPVGLGDESQIAEAQDGRLVMTVRTNHPVARPHDPLHQLFSVSTDGGETWGPAEANPDLRTSICMTSLAASGGRLYFSHPDDYYSRARMTVALSEDGGVTFPEKWLIYAGPSGYSDLGVLSDGDLLLLFENGAVEYDERLSLVRIPGR